MWVKITSHVLYFCTSSWEIPPSVVLDLLGYHRRKNERIFIQTFLNGKTSPIEGGQLE